MLIGISSVFVLIIGICIYFYLSKENNYNMYTSNIADKKKNSIGGFLTLMLETEADSGVYEKSTSSTWPEDGYIFNSELSSCENGGELDYDSEKNKVILYNNKSDACYVYFDLYTIPLINSINLGEVTNNSITISVSATNGTNEISNYYYIINDGTPVSTTNNTYTFSGLTSGETYTIKVYVVDIEGYQSEVSSLSVETESIVYLADYIKNTVFQGDGVNGLYYHDGIGSYTNANLEAGDNNYRFSGGYALSSKASSSGYEHVFAATNDDVNELIVRYNSNGVRRTMQNGGGSINDYFTLAYNESVHYENAMLALQKALTDGYLIENVKNYVCFASNSNPCPENNLYRILGLYQNDGTYQIKLIKNNSIGTYAWNTTADSSWPTASLNTILNTTFLNDLGSWSSLISNYSWSINGLTHFGNTSSIKTSYDEEVANSTLYYDAKIGLMYITDYGYAANPDFWNVNLWRYWNAVNSNWMYIGTNEWTISKYYSTSAVYIFSSGWAGNDVGEPVTHVYDVRPTFFLNENVKITRGDGSYLNPFYLEL